MNTHLQLRRAARLAAAVAVALGLAACGSGGSEAVLTKGTSQPTTPGPAPVPPRPSGNPADVNKPACDVLSQDDVAASLGNPVRPGTGTAKYCHWGNSADRGSNASLTINRADQCDVIKNSLRKDANSESVGGVGNSAVWNWRIESILTQGDFVVCWPDSVVWISISGEKDQRPLRDEASNLAQRAHNKL